MNTALRCHPYTICPRDGVRRADGSEVFLRPKTWAVLLYLIDHRDRPVSKDELLAAVWDGLIVHEQAVFQSISEIRAALQPLRCIQTLRGRGYRWVAEANTAVTPRAPLPRLLAACAMLLIALLALAADSPPAPVQPLQLLLQAEQSAALPLELLNRAMPGIELHAGDDDDTDRPRLNYSLVFRGEQAQLAYRLHYRSESVSGFLRGNLNTLVYDLATQIAPLLLIQADSAQLAHVYRDFPRAVQAADDGRHREAIALLESLLRSVPDFAPARAALAELMLQAGDQARARELAMRVANGRRAAVLGRVRSRAQLVLAQLALSDQDFAQGADWATRAAHDASASGDLYQHALAQETLAEVALAEGDLERALRQLRLSQGLYAGFCPTGTRRVAQRLRKLDEAVHAAPLNPQAPRI